MDHGTGLVQAWIGVLLYFSDLAFHQVDWQDIDFGVWQ